MTRNILFKFLLLSIIVLSIFYPAKLYAKVIINNYDDLEIALVNAISELADASDTPFLKELLKSKSYIVRTFASKALIRLGNTQAREELIKDFNDPKNKFRLLTAETLGYFKIYPNITQEMAKLESQDISEQKTALRTIVKLSIDNLRPILITKANNPNPEISLYAIGALSDRQNIDNDAVFKTLLSLLKNPSQDIRLKAITTIAKLYDKDKSDKEHLTASKYNIKISIKLRSLLNDKSIKIKAETISALGSLKDSFSIPKIKGFLSEPVTSVRESSLVFLRKMNGLSNPEDLLLLKPLLNDPDKKIQIAAINACAVSNNSALKQDLLAKLDNNDIDIKTQALIALYQLGETSIMDSFMQKPGLSNKLASANALAKTNPDQSIPMLLLLLKDTNSQVRQAAIRSLGTLKNKTTLPDLLNMLNDTDKEVKIETCIAIKNIGEHEAMPALKKSYQVYKK